MATFDSNLLLLPGSENRAELLPALHQGHIAKASFD
jgi:hypothetical protein